MPQPSTSSEARASGPLADVRVLDLTSGIAGPFTTKLLADLGADVIKVEPPGGDPARRLGPFLGDEPHPERSGLFAYLNSNKRGVVLDFDREGDRPTLRRLVLASDLVVESLPPGRLAEIGLSFDSLAAERPDIALVSITPFGQTGPYRDWRASELTLYAMGAEMHSVGLDDRPPLKTGGTSSLFQAGATAAVATMGALMSARRHGIGQWVDVAIMETHLSNVDRRPSALLAYQFTKETARRNPESGEGYPSGVYPCADGYVQISSSVPMWSRVVEMLGSPPALLDPKWTAPTAQNDVELLNEFNEIFYGWLFERTKVQVWEDANRVNLPCAPLNTWADIAADPVLDERGFWAEVDHPALGRVRLPGCSSTWSDTRPGLRHPAPLLGQHTEEVLAGVTTIVPGAAAQPVAPAKDSQKMQPFRSGRVGQRDIREAPAGAPLPLEGIRVLDFGVAWAGPFCTQLLADLGAEVIRVESTHYFPIATRGHVAHPTKQFLRGLAPIWGGYPDYEPGERPWNRSPMAINTFRNKHSMTVDLRNARGREILARLIAITDIVCENNATGTMEKLGITYDWMRAIDPGIIYVRMPGFGSTGSRAGVRSVGSSIEAYVGHTLLRGYTDLDVSKVPVIFPSDGFSGINGAFVAIAALNERLRSGVGQEISVAQAEAGLTMFPEAALEYFLNGHVSENIGNRDVHGAAPAGVYPCHGDDRWIAITVSDDAEWRGLCSEIGDPGLTGEAQYATAAGRREHHDALDELLGGWTRDQHFRELAARLQGAGVTAGPVLDARDCYEDPHLAARGYFQTITHKDTGTYPWPGMPFQFSATPLSIRRPPRDLGEDNEYVYRALLGVSGAEYVELERDGHIGTVFDADIP